MPSPYFNPLAPDTVPEPPEGYDPDDLSFSWLGDLTQKYQWNAWGDNCIICSAMNGKVYTLDFWINAGIWPGFHPNCDCTMKKVGDEVLTSDPDFFGTNIPEYSRMWLKGGFMAWDPTFAIQPWQLSILQNIEQMHLAAGSDTPIGEIIKQLGGTGPFSHRVSFPNDPVGFRIFATQRHFQNIDGSYSGSRLFTPERFGYILEPLWIWFERNFTIKHGNYQSLNNKYMQMVRTDTPMATLRPQSLKPLQPYQSYATEVE